VFIAAPLRISRMRSAGFPNRRYYKSARGSVTTPRHPAVMPRKFRRQNIVCTMWHWLANLCDNRLDHAPIQLNRIMVLIPCLSMIFSENRYPLFGIML